MAKLAVVPRQGHCVLELAQVIKIGSVFHDVDLTEERTSIRPLHCLPSCSTLLAILYVEVVTMMTRLKTRTLILWSFATCHGHHPTPTVHLHT